jgi:hypothetical protein
MNHGNRNLNLNGSLGNASEFDKFILSSPKQAHAEVKKSALNKSSASSQTNIAAFVDERYYNQL